MAVATAGNTVGLGSLSNHAVQKGAVAQMWHGYRGKLGESIAADFA